MHRSCDIQANLDRLATLGAGADDAQTDGAAASAETGNNEPAGTYEGERNAKGERHGQGTMTYANKDVYKGSWANDKMNGRGKYRKNVTTKYKYDWEFDGEFKNNCPVNGLLYTPQDQNGPSEINRTNGVTIFAWNPLEIPSGSTEKVRGRVINEEEARELQAEIAKRTEERETYARKKYDDASEERQRDRQRVEREIAMMHGPGFRH
jgi:hypothetical protein